MKKTLAVLMMLLLLAMLIVSCEADSPVIIHKVTFNSDNGSEAKVESVIDGEKTVKPADPVMTGYTFLGWYDGDTPFDFEASVKKDYSLTAKWQIQTFTVSFDANGGEGNYVFQAIDYGAKVDTTKVSNPTRTEYTFLGWFDGESKVDLSTLIVTKDYELKARWNINSYTVTFDSDGGTPYDSQSVEYNNTTTSPGTPEKDGCTFMGWYKDSEKFDFDKSITENITLKAKWGYTVTFSSNEGSSVASQVVEQGGTVTKPADPTKGGQVFVGWYVGNNEFKFDSPITKETELTAKWRDYYIVGDIGPAGGIIIYVAESDQTSTCEINNETYSYTWRYLEAAPTDAPGRWYTWGPNMSLGTEKGVGDGWKNMVKFMDEVGGLATFPAAKACGDYSVTVGDVTYDDWFLPSEDELSSMVGKVNLSQRNYFSSTEDSNDKSRMLWWNDYSEEFDGLKSIGKSGSAFVRPVRAFLTWDKTNNPPTLTIPTTQYTVTFNLNDGEDTVYTQQKVKKGRTAIKPATNPKKDGCIFDKWTTDKDGKNVYDFTSSGVNEDLTLYAQWTTLVVGDTVYLGTYPSNYDYSYLQGKPIPWRVLAIADDKKSALLFSQNVLEKQSFYNSNSIHKYLKDNLIGNYGLSGVDMCNVDVGGESTNVGSGEAKVFLLSRTEARNYLDDNAKKGASVSWWLRTTAYKDTVCIVSTDGSITSEGNDGANPNEPLGLRPAFWINLNMSK